MCYSASDLANDTAQVLTELGYVIEPTEPDADGEAEHWWDLGKAGIGRACTTANSAAASALQDLKLRFLDLQGAAAAVLAANSNGRGLSESIRSLEEALDGCIPGDVAEFVATQSKSCHEG